MDYKKLEIILPQQIVEFPRVNRTIEKRLSSVSTSQDLKISLSDLGKIKNCVSVCWMIQLIMMQLFGVNPSLQTPPIIL